MGRPDGRIEKGQSLNRAISARAWNRAQDAADVVLGVTPGFEVGAINPSLSRLIAGVQIQIPPGFNNGIPPGVAVRITGSVTTVSGQQSGAEISGCANIQYLTGEVTNIDNYSEGIHGAIGLTIEGARQASGTSVVIPTVISGLAYARVRRFDVTHRFAINPIRRISESDNSRYRGILDSHPCACDSSVRVVSYHLTASTYTDATGAPIVWAVVIV